MLGAGIHRMLNFYKSGNETVSMSRAAYQRDYRSRRRAIGGGPLRLPVETPVAGTIREPDPAPPDDPAGAVAEWSKARLKVPPGHRLSGEALILPDFAVRFFREALADGIREAGLFCARKNGKKRNFGRS